MGAHPWHSGMWSLSTIRLEAFGADDEGIYACQTEYVSDGGIARFRLFGHAVQSSRKTKKLFLILQLLKMEVLQSLAVINIWCHLKSDPTGTWKGHGRWLETSRSRGKDHVDWAIIRLGAPCKIQSLLVDTAFFRGNFPQKAKVEAIGLAW